MFQYQRSQHNKNPKLPNGNKQNKQNCTSVRAGDWICLLCNNLNFSFRNECNRCQMQTKKQNYLQLWQMQMMQENGIYDQQKMYLSKKNQPIMYLPATNQVQLQQLQQPNQDLPFQLQQQNYDQQSFNKLKRKPQNDGQNPQEFSKTLRESPSTAISDLNTTNTTANNDNEDNLSQGFQNRLLLAHTESKEDNFIQPYASPEKIPSISPILNNFKEIYLQETQQTVNNSNNQLEMPECNKRGIQSAQQLSANQKQLELLKINKYFNVTESEDLPSPQFGGQNKSSEDKASDQQQQKQQNQSDNEIKQSIKNLNLDQWDLEEENYNNLKLNKNKLIKQQLQKQRSQSLDDINSFINRDQEPVIIINKKSDSQENQQNIANQ